MQDINIFESKNKKFRLSFAWYDLWIGFFFDTKKKKIYICPMPMILITIKYAN